MKGVPLPLPGLEHGLRLGVTASALEQRWVPIPKN